MIMSLLNMVYIHVDMITSVGMSIDFENESDGDKFFLLCR